MHLFLGDFIYSRIQRTERVFKGHPKDPLVEETTFSWVIQGETNMVVGAAACI